MTTTTIHAQAPTLRGRSLKVKLLLIVTLIVLLITGGNIFLSSYLTYTQNEEEAHQKLAVQMRRFRRDLERFAADVLRTATEAGKNAQNLTDLSNLVWLS